MSRRTVVITGASAGVGRASARAFAAAGDDVALLARGSAGLEAAARDVRDAGRRAVVIQADVSDPDAVEAAAARVEDELGPIDVWVNNAFSSVFAKSWDIEPDEMRRLTEVTYLGFVWGTQAALRRMRPRDRGVIVQVGSALAYRGIPLQAGYCGAKHAIQGYTESVRCELMSEKSNVKITMVQMPALDTPQFSWVRSRLPKAPQPVPPIYDPHLAGEAVVYASQHPRRRERWLGASTAATLVANAVAPGLLDRYLGRTGIDGQQTEKPATAGPGNLLTPLDEHEDAGAHGDFGDQSHTRAPQWWLARHRHPLTAATLAATAALLARSSRRR